MKNVDKYCAFFHEYFGRTCDILDNPYLFAYSINSNQYTKNFKISDFKYDNKRIMYLLYKGYMATVNYFLYNSSEIYLFESIFRQKISKKMIDLLIPLKNKEDYYKQYDKILMKNFNDNNTIFNKLNHKITVFE